MPAQSFCCRGVFLRVRFFSSHEIVSFGQSNERKKKKNQHKQNQMENFNARPLERCEPAANWPCREAIFLTSTFHAVGVCLHKNVKSIFTPFGLIVLILMSVLAIFVYAFVIEIRLKTVKSLEMFMIDQS